MNREEKKRAAACAALEFVIPGEPVGVGTGSTANAFIEALGGIRGRIDAAVASSKETASRLAAAGIRVVDLNAVSDLPVYIDGADECTRHRHLIKGGGGALVREKIVAEAAGKFICIVDDSKRVERLGRFPLPIEVIPMARALVARKMVRLGGRPERRVGFLSDNGNEIIDIHDLDILDPPALEADLNQIPGVVANGIFARRGADVILMATEEGIESL
ncbi:ribose-5-phosphate isomerase RpiA [Thioalkalivibrio sp. HK1]|uniref:ribose-5-phosphate isomerase RpiA n=1 Tax=Thioalkalivibrio sp. HK1 TaxID=1469245 RepID=UPI000470B91B|nr:ribose-5-phosphate isomerase RpiA [Thioalkalivibrio sp. HK1]